MTSESKRRSKRHGWMATLFLAAGVFMIGIDAWSILRWNSARSWPTSGARIESVELRSGSDGRRGSSKTILRVSYEYEWDGETRVGAAVSPFDWVMLKSDKKHLAAELRRAKPARQPATCYVNPSDPDDAYLNREFLWGGVLAAGGVGLAFVGAGVLLFRQQRRM